MRRHIAMSWGTRDQIPPKSQTLVNVGLERFLPALEANFVAGGDGAF